MSKLIKTAIETARSLNLDLVTIKEMESLDLPEIIELKPKQIKAIRSKAHVRQGVMAKYLNVCVSTYQKWERGEVKPHGGKLAQYAWLNRV